MIGTAKARASSLNYFSEKSYKRFVQRIVQRIEFDRNEISLPPPCPTSQSLKRTNDDPVCYEPRVREPLRSLVLCVFLFSTKNCDCRSRASLFF